jgi:hypothetical protein
LPGLVAVFAVIPGITVLGLSLAAQAATNISGMVTDSITGLAVAGARVTLSSGQTSLSVGTAASDGVFQMFVDLPVKPVPKTYTLEVSQQGYATQPRNVVVTSGQADQLSYKVALPRNEAIGCVPDPGRTVVIGHVRPPASATHDLDLSRRVRTVLEYDLLTEVQKTHLPPAQQPAVFSCPNALPRTMKEHSDWARALKADAFVVGEAAPVNGNFKVDMQVSARYAESASLPTLATTPEMNLDLPSSADLGRAALEPIMIALLRAYLKEGRYAECVEFSMAAESALGQSTVLGELRKSCQLKLPNKGLLSGGGQ